MAHSSGITDSLEFKRGIGKGLSRDDPVKWNQAWDQHLTTKFRMLERVPDSLDLFGNMDALLCDALSSQHVIGTFHTKKQELCTLQYDLAEFVSKKRATDQFDRKWLKMSSHEREIYLLEGLLISCGAFQDIEDSREHCPETIMTNLQRDGGKGFLDLLTTFCPSNSPLERRSEPLFLSHPFYDRLYRVEDCSRDGPNSARSTMKFSELLQRNTFLAFFLWNTMLNIYGTSETYKTSRLGGEKQDLRATERAYRNTRAAISHEETMAYREKVAAAELRCVTCQAPRDALPGKMFSCIKCRKIGRTVLYCGKKCQTADWRNGTPPHKDICGKELQLPSNIQVTPMQRNTASLGDTQDEQTNRAAGTSNHADDRFPEPDAGFRRTAALELQISLLSENPNTDYYLIAAPNLACQMQHPVGRIHFRNMRHQAMRTGDPRCVAFIYTILNPMTSNGGFNSARLMLQLSKEYAIPLDVLSRYVEHLNAASRRSR